MNMSVVGMKKILFLFICAQYMFCLTSGCLPFARSWNLHVINGIPHADAILRIRVVSERDDFGYHNLTYNGPEYFLHFCETVTHTTAIRSDLWHESKRGFLWLFNTKIADFFKPLPFTTQNIYWKVQEDGFYLSGKKDSGYVFWSKW
ncbi:hypothetical protein R6Q59_036968 [Mikania micrantha]